MSRSQGSLLVPMLSFSGQLKLGLYNHQLRIGLTFTTTNQKSIFPKPSKVYQSEMYTLEESQIKFTATPNKLIIA